jgi:hypothetical protein
VEVFEERIVGVHDIPGAFLHAKQTDLVYFKMTGELTAFIMEVSPDKYSEYVILEKGKETIYLRLEKALCGCLKSALLFWKDLLGSLLKQGYISNAYDLCVANNLIEESQLTIVWRVDDLKVGSSTGQRDQMARNNLWSISLI